MHGHGLAVGLYFASWLVIVIFARDVLRAAYGDRGAVRGLASSLGG